MEISVILTYGLLLLSIFNLPFKSNTYFKIPLWSLFLLLSIASGLCFNFLEVHSVAYIAVFALSVYGYYQTRFNFSFFMVVFLLAVPLIMHLPFLGFNNYKYLDQVQVSENAYPFSMYFNLDKSIVGVFILGFSPKDEPVNFVETFKKFFLYLLVMLVLFWGLTMSFSFVEIDVKWPSYTLVFMLNNLFLVCVMEEAFFRKFIQNEILKRIVLQRHRWVGILLSAIVFGVAHFQGGILYVFLAFIAGLFYGNIYNNTKRIESAVFLHFMFNTVHFLFFTYPALKA